MLLRVLYWAFSIPCVEQRHVPGCSRYGSCHCVRRLRKLRFVEVLKGVP